MQTKEIIEKCLLRTYSGKLIDPTNLTVDDIVLDDIAASLAKQCRYAGHYRTFRHYSIAEHSLFVHKHIQFYWAENYGLCFAALLHDASEAYLNDIVTPFKNSLPQYRELEKKVMAVIYEKFDLEIYLKEEYQKRIKEADKFALVHEMAELFDGNPSLDINFYTPEEAYRKFKFEARLYTTHE